MTLPVWPSSLPRPRADGFRERSGKRFESFAVDRTGAERRRAVTTAAPRSVDFTLTLTAAQRATLLGFFETDLRGGTLRFTWPHPVTGVSAPALFAEEPALSPRPNSARWIGQVSLKVFG